MNAILILSALTTSQAAAVGEHTLLDTDICFDVGYHSGLEACIVEKGVIHSVLTPSGNYSLTINTETSVEIYRYGELLISDQVEERAHGLKKKGSGDWFQVHDDYCRVLDYGWVTYSYSLFVNVANGEVRTEVEVYDDPTQCR